MDKKSDFKYSGTDNLEIMTEARNYNSFLSKLVNKYCDKGKNIVDFGAGIGTFSAPLNDGNKNVIAVEPDESQRQRLTSLGISNVPDINMIEDGWADVIYSINVLEHIEDDEAAIRSINSKLKPSGKAFIYVPAFQVIYSSMDKKVGHFRRYRRHDLTDKMTRAGMDILEAHYADSLGFIASLIFKYMGNDNGSLNKTSLILFDRFIFPISRILDLLTSTWFGKNLIVVAKPRAKQC